MPCREFCWALILLLYAYQFNLYCDIIIDLRMFKSKIYDILFESYCLLTFKKSGICFRWSPYHEGIGLIFVILDYKLMERARFFSGKQWQSSRPKPMYLLGSQVPTMAKPIGNIFPSCSKLPTLAKRLSEKYLRVGLQTCNGKICYEPSILWCFLKCKLTKPR